MPAKKPPLPIVLVKKKLAEHVFRRAPKIGCTPIISVKKAATKTISNVRVIMVLDGCPVSKQPVRIANHLYVHRTGYSMNKKNPTLVSSTYSAVIPFPALTRATVNASKIQPTTSLPTPAERVTTPTVVSRSFVSVRIRHKTGNAVMHTATAENRTK